MRSYVPRGSRGSRSFQWGRIISEPTTGDIEQETAATGEIAAVRVILEHVCRLTGMGFAAVARVTPDRWVTCQVVDTIHFGLAPGDELPVETTLCNEVRTCLDPVVISHVARDPVYRDHPTPARYGFQSFISVPILLPDGSFFGTLCALDPSPAYLNSPQIIETFRLYADLIGFHLHAQQRVAAAEETLKAERDTAELREQFIAVLGHDLRNPLASVAAGTSLLARTDLDERAREVLPLMLNAVQRMNNLVGNLMDFARGRLGGGLSLHVETKLLAPTLDQVLAEIRTVYPDRVIDTDCDPGLAFTGDHVRIGQLLSNLLGNAVTHGAADVPVRIRAADEDGALVLSVSNGGEPIAPAALKLLFQPFSRGKIRPNQQGLGLGLFIASEIARAHGGTLSVSSTPEATCFTLRIPAAPEARAA